MEKPDGDCTDLLRQESASKAQQEVTNTTNDLLTKTVKC